MFCSVMGHTSYNIYSFSCSCQQVGYKYTVTTGLLDLIIQTGDRVRGYNMAKSVTH